MTLKDDILSTVSNSELFKLIIQDKPLFGIIPRKKTYIVRHLTVAQVFAISKYFTKIDPSTVANNMDFIRQNQQKAKDVIGIALGIEGKELDNLTNEIVIEDFCKMAIAIINSIDVSNFSKAIGSLLAIQIIDPDPLETKE